MLVAVGVPGRTAREPLGEAEVNTWANPSRARDGAGRVSGVSTTTPRKRPPLVIVLAVLVPVLALAVAAAVASSSGSDDEASSTTLVQDGDPAATATSEATSSEAGDGEGSGSKADATTTTERADEGGSDEADDEGASGGDAPGGDPRAGGETERPTVTYPQPTVPEAGCSRPKGTAVITLAEVPDPPCLELSADQAVVFRNRTGREISVVAIGLNEVVPPGSEAKVGAAMDVFGDGRSTFWSPGNPQLSGIVEVG